MCVCMYVCMYVCGVVFVGCLYVFISGMYIHTFVHTYKLEAEDKRQKLEVRRTHLANVGKEIIVISKRRKRGGVLTN